MMIKLLALITTTLVISNANAENASSENLFSTNAKLIGLTYHPGGGNALEGKQYPRALDDEGYFVMQLGLEADLDYKYKPWLHFRFTTALYKDCIDVWAGWFGLMPRLNHEFDFGLRVNFGIGPSIIWRESWWNSDYVKYNGDVFFGRENTGDDVQVAFLWYGGNLEMSYDINKDHGVVLSVIPGYPQVFTHSLGWRYNW
jgi:hypothetical protein